MIELKEQTKPHAQDGWYGNRGRSVLYMEYTAWNNSMCITDWYAKTVYISGKAKKFLFGEIEKILRFSSNRKRNSFIKNNFRKKAIKKALWKHIYAKSKQDVITWSGEIIHLTIK